MALPSAAVAAAAAAVAEPLRCTESDGPAPLEDAAKMHEHLCLWQPTNILMQKSAWDRDKTLDRRGNGLAYRCGHHLY
jgi:hypothetical protein